MTDYIGDMRGKELLKIDIFHHGGYLKNFLTKCSQIVT